MKQMSTLTLGKNIYEINDAIARKLITELSKNLDNIKIVDGKSAYEVAVDNGFSGTEQEWLASLGQYDDVPIWKVQGEYGAKNLLEYPYERNYAKSGYNGTFFKVNSDGSILVSCTENVGYSHASLYGEDTSKYLILPAGDYIFSDGCGATSNRAFLVLRIYEYDSEGTATLILEKYTYNGSAAFTITDEIYQKLLSQDARINIRAFVGGGINADGQVLYPMIRVASDTDSTWQPYVPTNQLVNKKLEDKIVKNHIRYPYASVAGTVAGMTISVDSEGTITLDGTSTGYVIFNLVNTTDIYLEKGWYILSADFGEISDTNVAIQIGNVKNGIFYSKGSISPTSANKLTYRGDEYVNSSLCIRVVVTATGVTLENATISNIMLRKADIIDDTWKPYEMSNKQLTDAIISNGEEITNEATVSQELKANYFYLFSNAVENLTITLPSNRQPWNEFNFAFTTSSSGCNLALPSAVTWLGDTPTLDADTYYEVSIKNDKAVIA